MTGNALSASSIVTPRRTRRIRPENLINKSVGAPSKPRFWRLGWERYGPPRDIFMLFGWRKVHDRRWEGDCSDLLLDAPRIRSPRNFSVLNFNHAELNCG